VPSHFQGEKSFLPRQNLILPSNRKPGRQPRHGKAELGTIQWTQFSNAEREMLDHNEIVNGQTRSQIQPGMKVRIVEKQNQRTGKLTEGIVQRVLTRSLHHPHGIKVMLANGIVGRVKEIVQ